MSGRPRVLIFCRTYLPGFLAGGPVRTLANLVSALGDELDFRIVTMDRDYGSSVPYPDITRDCFGPVGKAQVCYLAPQDVSQAAIDAIVAKCAPDVLYLNSLTDRVLAPKGLRCRKRGPGRGVPTIIAVRGQLNPGAMAIRRPLKLAYLAWLKGRGLLDGVIWQATGLDEADAIRNVIGERFLHERSEGIAIVPNISFADFADAGDWRPRPTGAPLRIALLGRTSPMKNIAYAIDVIDRATAPMQLDIYGPLEDAGYLARCRDRGAALRAGAECVFHGPVEPARIGQTLSTHDCFLLPTRGENFGHAIAEALASGLPAIISDRTPWRDLADHGVGAAFSLTDPQSFADELDRLALLTEEELRSRHLTCIRYAKSALADPATLKANRKLFVEAAAGNFPM